MNPRAFIHDTAAQRVRFGAGLATDHAAAEIEALGARRVFLISSGSAAAVANRLAAALPVVATQNRATQHVPHELAEAARASAIDADADAIVVVGGGSAIGLAKAVALTTGLPIVAVPTTFAGSEATDVWGITEHGRKTTGSDARVRPVAVVYDSELLATLPVELTVASGLNAVAHCVDSLWAPRADPINGATATEGLRLLADGLRGVAAAPGDSAHLEQIVIGAYLGAVAFASAGSGLHHKICHVLGGAYSLPHAQLHAVVLPNVVAFNAEAAPDAAARIVAALGRDDADAASALRALDVELGAPTSLTAIGFESARIAEAAALILPSVPPSNPRPVTISDLERLLTAASGLEAPSNDTEESL
jgi:maleylacetate reductase